MELNRGAAIVTGAAGGIGAAMVARLRGLGMAVVAADIDGGRLDSMRESVVAGTAGAGGGAGADAGAPAPEVVTVVGDVADPEHHQRLVAAAGELGGLRLSVLNAGTNVTGWSWELPLDRWRKVIDTNYWGVAHGLRVALSEMVPAGEGWVVAVASGAGLVAPPGMVPYVSSKHAVVGMLESVHHELARIGSSVGVSVACPGNIATGLSERSGMVGDPQDAALSSLYATIRSGVAEGASPDTVVDAVVTGVQEGRFWLLPQPELGWVAQDRTRRLAEGDGPVDLLG
jgi:NAD(P)-dependent dehydrogenase (short-subunit alcohol dehydrogenase family)